VEWVSESRKVTVDTLPRIEQPEDVRVAFEFAYRWYQTQWFVRQVVERQLDFFNCSLKIKGLPDSLDEDWARRYVEDLWRDRLIYDNAITLWTDQIKPTTLPIERCEYTDALGIERLKFYSPWRVQDFGENGTLAKRFATGTVEIEPSAGEHYRVLKTARVGAGLGRPSLYTVFRCLSEAESLEVGESLLAFCTRTVIRQHQLGHEIKAGPKAGQGIWFINKTREDAIKKFFQGRVGFAEAASNFDHKILYVTPDPKLFVGAKWETVLNRLVWWGGPIGFMLLNRGINPFLMPLLRQQALTERSRIAQHVEQVFRDKFGVEDLTLQWSNRCFADPRVGADLLKTGLASGPISQTSFVEEACLDPDEEKERKRKEAAEDPKLHLPIYDKDHGQKPAQNLTGRPPGTPDP
jgi:hypothetical protein